jgi:hypothetical protein
MVCSQPPVQVSFPAVVRLRFCGDVVCMIRLVHTMSEGEANSIEEEFAIALDALTEKYGRPESSSVTVPAACQGRLASCLREGTATLEARWKWASGESIALQAAAGLQDAHLLLEYLPPGAPAAAPGGM